MYSGKINMLEESRRRIRDRGNFSAFANRNNCRIDRIESELVLF